MASTKNTKLNQKMLAVTARHEIFVEEYIANGGNGTQAAIAAGYKKRTAGVTAAKLLKKANVSDKIAARQAELAKKKRLDTDSVLEVLSNIVHADPRRLYDENNKLKDIQDWPDDVALAVAGIDTVTTKIGDDATVTTNKVKFYDKNAGIDKAMKHLGLYSRDNEQKGPFAGLDREFVKAIVERLRAINAQRIS